MSSDDLVAKFDELVRRFKQDFNETIERERAKMKAEIEAYNKDMKTMKAFAVNDNDIIHLNIGGQKLTTKRSTLCQVENSLLASMFSGPWDSGHKRDKDGAVFLDYEPQYFVPVLSYLRAKTFATPENPASLPRIPEDQIKDFKNFVDYLGLSDEIFPVEIAPSEKFNVHSPGVSLEEGRTAAVHGPDRGFRYVLGENLYRLGTRNLKLNIESFQDNGWMFVGIVKRDVAPPDNNSYGWRGSYGWALGRYGGIWKDGSCANDNALNNVTKQGDTAELILDCDGAKLSLRLSTGGQFHIEIPKSETWRLHVNLDGSNDKIGIMNE